MVVNTVKLILFKTFFFILSYIVPKDDKLLVFQTMFGKGLREDPKYLYLYAKRFLKDYKLVYFLSEEEDKEYKFCNIKKHKIKPTAFWKILRAKHIFIEATSLRKINLSSLIGRFNIILCWHGFAYKKMEYVKKEYSFIKNWLIKLETKKFKLITASYEPSKKWLEDALFNNNVKVLGRPKNDIFFNKDVFSLEKPDKKFSLKRYRKVILYAPTWRDKDGQIEPFSEEFLLKLNKLLTERRWILYLKPHPFTKKIKIINNLSNIKDISKEISDTHEMLAHSDILITDYSSVMFDFSLLEKPIIFFFYDMDKYQKKRKIYLNFRKIIPGPVANNESELIATLKNIKKLTDNKKYKEKMKKFKDTFNYYIDGKSSERVFKALKLIKR
ncbi:CDP-glycerol glycerophosphotransferase family protein [Candidatus Woesearchaeota archaeon]|nr:CDP-glycerol glycerophosphotransferase family protein [Candidatus Woesearchaeota archaeon]